MTSCLSAQDVEGVEVAIKIDRMDSRKCSSETATKAYVEVRAEVSILHSLVHLNVIEFIGVVLQPLCFILEWAPGGSLSSVFQKYRKQDARIGPLTLQRVTQQVSCMQMYLAHVMQNTCATLIIQLLVFCQYYMYFICNLVGLM